jgi:hypothetical protein
VAKVDITTAGHTIILDDPDVGAKELAAIALDLWRQTRDPKLDRAWGVAGAILERADGPTYTAEAGADLRAKGPQ